MAVIDSNSSLSANEVVDLHVFMHHTPECYNVCPSFLGSSQQEGRHLAVVTGGVLLHSALYSEVGGGSLGGQCAGQCVQHPQETGRPLSQQYSGSDPCYAD